MNLINEFKKGQDGQNKGLYMGDGISSINKTLNGIQQGMLYGVAGAAKSGKTTFTDYAFVIQPYLYAIENKIPVKWIYFSFEIDRISKEFDFLTYFLYHDFGIKEIKLNNQRYIDNNGLERDVVNLSPSFLRGRIQDKNGDIIKVDSKLLEKIKSVYNRRIVPIFGEYDEDGIQQRKGYVDIIETSNNPTGLYNYLKDYAENNGKFLGSNNKFNLRNSGYKPNNPNKFTIIIVDHLRRILREKNYSLKEAIDKFLEYSIILKRTCNFTFVEIIHLNRGISDVSRIKYNSDTLYPNDSDLKDTGNLSEDCDYLFTLFDPNDDKYKIDEHFGLKIRDTHNNIIYPNMRTVHLVQSRHSVYPQHYRLNMLGNLKTFEKLKI